MNRILKDKRGDVTTQTVIIALMLLVIIFPVYQYARILTVSNSVKNAVRNGLIASVTSNYQPSYNGMREGNSGAYEQSSGRWQSSLSYGSTGKDIGDQLSLQQNGNTYTKNDSNGKKQYSISNIQINIQNADFRSNSIRLSAHVTYTLNIPIHFLNTDVEQNYNMHTDCEFEPKF